MNGSHFIRTLKRPLNRSPQLLIAAAAAAVLGSAFLHVHIPWPKPQHWQDPPGHCLVSRTWVP